MAKFMTLERALRALWSLAVACVAVTLTIRLNMANNTAASLAEDPLELWIGVGVLVLLCDVLVWRDRDGTRNQ